MKQTKLISLLLVLCMVVALLVPGTVAMEAKAADGDDTEGLVVNKTATAKGDGIYTITLEAYATGESTTISTSEDVPTDIILVLDVSGSMSKNMSVVSFKEYVNRTNSDLYNLRHNQDTSWNKNLYYQLESGEYVTVAVEITNQEYAYTPITKGMNNSTGGWGGGNTNYWNNQNNLYAKVDGVFQKVRVERSRTDNGLSPYVYYYYLEDGTLIAESSNYNGIPQFDGIDGNILYLRDTDPSKNVYEYFYTIDNEKKIIGTSTGANTTSRDFKLHQRSESGSVSRLNALKNAATTFAKSVREKAIGDDGIPNTSDEVEHKIAVVSFADAASNLTNGLIDMTGNGAYNTVGSAIQSLRANGNTKPDEGIRMANNIFEQNPISQDDKRNRVIVLFTDGYPAPGGTDNIKYDWCDSAISAAYASKHTYGATVYTVGIFDGANPTGSISEGFNYGSTNTSAQLVAANRYMHLTSSNYNNATDMRSTGVESKDGYYLSAADAGTLNSIFEQIAGSIESGGTTVKLDGNSVIRDVVSPYFKLPDGATPENISLSLVPCTGVNQSGELTWGGSEQAEGVSATVDGRNISVTGFDFSGNWCGPRTVDGETKYSGKKLVISFVVETEPGFLGGNNVPTNANAGVYENPDKTEPLKKFPVPEVNVPIKDITVTAGDKNVYLLGDLTKEQLTSGATVEAGENIEITLDPTVKNYGLQPWQYAFVEIKTSLTDSENNPLNNGFTDLKKDTDYHLTVTVSPKEEAKETSDGTPAGEKTNQDTAKVNVFKPEITWQDTCIDAGKTPVYKSDESVDQNFVSLNWKHVETISTDKGVTMIGSKPILTYTYDPEAKPLTEETPVKVTVKIDDQDVTTDSVFVHDDECTFDNCKWETEYKGKGYHFVVHLNTFDLTIEKSGCNETLDPNQSFVFRVTGPNGFSMEVVIKGNGTTTIKNLPAGEYTVKEDINWSWRYEPSGNSLTGNPENPEVTFSNTRNNDYWLDGNAYCENPFEGIPATK